MIPLRDLNPTRTRPRVTWALIAANAGVYAVCVLLGDEGYRVVIERLGLVPVLFTSGAVLVPEASGGAMGHLLTPLSSMFLHGGFFHVLGNMWFLHIFGDNVEDALGGPRYLAFYFAAGLGAACAQVLVDPSSTIPMIGASGAVSGVLGAYLVLYPRARIQVLVPIFVIVSFFEWPAFVVVGEWLVIQIVSGLFALTAETRAGGVAWFAHLGGFLVGLVSARALSDVTARTGAARFD